MEHVHQRVESGREDQQRQSWRTQACQVRHWQRTLRHQARTVERWDWTRHQRCSQTAQSATVDRTTESSRLTLQCLFSSADLPDAGNFDAQRSTEHEMDEVLGLGSRLGQNGNDFRPQDLFSWSSAGHRNITSSGTRYFSIDGGVTNIVNFNQNPDGDFGDWLSEDCPQTHPYVQNAFGCARDNIPTSRPHRRKASISMSSATI